jgi:hypothetical protein
MNFKKLKAVEFSCNIIAQLKGLDDHLVFQNTRQMMPMEGTPHDSERRAHHIC